MVGRLSGGLLVLFAPFWVAYGVIWFVSHSLFHLSHRVILLVAGGFMTLVVIVGARQNWQNWILWSSMCAWLNRWMSRSVLGTGTE